MSLFVCDLCNRAWLGYFNRKWGDKHAYDGINPRFWRMGYNQYFPRKPRWNRAVIYNPIECNSKRFKWWK